MKKITIMIYLSIVFILVGCSTNEESTNGSPIESTSQDKSEIDNNNSASTSEESENNNTDITSSENSDLNVDDEEDKDSLSQYSSEQIEYARVWLQLGPNQEIDELYVNHISAGELINPNDDTSATYPEDVIQLSGSRLVDGSVTYSGNGDGTINVYNVPLRWDGIPPEELEEGVMRKETEKIIENTESVYIDPADDEDVIRLIELQNNH
ncbi:hypothetical protein [Ornithinibacillus xuwenensis]|uniref:Lipoprotein n=1 Tax=Ornithinibacillus xuwenensis TaxID=3144668 RepID=A0ABU9XK26_9BACI